MNSFFINFTLLLIILICHFLINTFLLEKNSKDLITKKQKKQKKQQIKLQKQKLKQLKEHMKELELNDFSVEDMKSDLLQHIDENGITKVVMDQNNVNNSSFVRFHEREYNSNENLDESINYIDKFFKEIPHKENNYQVEAELKQKKKKHKLSAANNTCLNGGSFFDNVYANDNLGSSIFAPI